MKLSLPEKMKVRTAISKFVRGRDWIERNKVEKETMDRFYETVEKPFNALWDSLLSKMSPQDLKEFHDLLAVKTVAPAKVNYVVEPVRRDDKKSSRPSEKSKRRKPNLKSKQQELF